MPYQEYEDGLYLLKQKSARKGVAHYGIMDVGNRLRHPGVNGQQPVVIHQTPPTIKMDWLQDTGDWLVLGKITDEEDAISRLNIVLQKPNYNLFVNNCEHFARYVATGRYESTQLQAAVFMGGLVAISLMADR